MKEDTPSVVAAEASLAATVAGREEALALLDRIVPPKDKRKRGQKITLGAETQFQEDGFIQGLRNSEVAPHASERVKGKPGQEQPDGGGAARPKARDQPAEAHIDRAGFRLE
jgi:hypothetical protein